MYIVALYANKGMKSREERVLHGEVKPEVAKTTVEIEQVEEEQEVFYDRVCMTHVQLQILCICL